MAQTLMIYNGTTDETADEPRTGGIPLVPADFSWPHCDTCDGAMKFLAHLPVEQGVVSVFQCENDPGLCEEWEAFEGGNRAFLFPREGLVPAAVPAEGETLLGAVSAIRLETVDEDTYNDAREQYRLRSGRGRLVLGSLGGEADWFYEDQWPACPGCGQLMTFVAHLEEGNDSATAANFGGGCGYVLVCDPCRSAAFLTQS
ncbi:hypothetical protein [Streptomyces sp. BE147]|uniref:hypothetical protein n=1 Tax=unclassified Streptomyces TaxID=2593676 RepID=UPI002E7A6AB3|nr:hypothetical protein [Streptomyces sp. BE147]MEE1739530.1 hypothetical protein [Streptomyces sp. BE147]